MRGSPTVWKLSFMTPSPGWSLSLNLLSLFLSFIFCPTFQREWAAFLGAWCLPPAFRSCSVKVTQHSNDLLMNLWGRKWSPVLFLHHLQTASWVIFLLEFKMGCKAVETSHNINSSSLCSLCMYGDVCFTNMRRFQILEDSLTNGENILVYSSVPMWKWLIVLLWGTNIN